MGKYSRSLMMPLYINESGTRGASSIVFLHGAGAGSWMWGRQTAALADYHCLTVDLPGHGQSNRETWTTFADTSDQIAKLIQARASNARAHIVGLSLGGYLALVLLERCADVVDHVVITGVTASPVPNRSLLTPQLWLLSILMQRRWFADMQARAMHVPPDMQAAFTKNVQAMSMEAYRRIAKEAVDYQLPDSLRRVNNPTLVAAGSRESDIIREAVEAIPKIMPNARGCLVPGLGHGWNVEAPDLFNRMIRAWITDKPLPDGLQSVSSP